MFSIESKICPFEIDFLEYFGVVDIVGLGQVHDIKLQNQMMIAKIRTGSINDSFFYEKDH